MSEDLIEVLPRRKILSIKKEKEATDQPCFVEKDSAVYMVWRVGGDMPKRVYRSKEKALAVSHAQLLSAQTGLEFHVLRSYRGFIAVPSN